VQATRLPLQSGSIRTEGGSPSPENASSICQRVEDNALHLGSAPKSRLPLGGTDLADIKFGVGRFPKKEEFQRFSFSSIIKMF
jgi:hypothetical protein